MAWIHIKVWLVNIEQSINNAIHCYKLEIYGILYLQALRVFVESVLRYGLPVNFQAMVLLPQKKTQKKLRDVLNQQYIHLDSPGGGSSADVSFCILGR